MATAQPLSLRDKRILIVEDQYLIATDLSRVLTSMGGVIVGPVATTEAARAELTQTGIDFAFLDVSLDGQMVFPLADELERRNIPFIFATGHDVTILPDRFRSKLRLEKPFTLQTVRAAVRQLTSQG